MYLSMTLNHAKDVRQDESSTSHTRYGVSKSPEKSKEKKSDEALL